MLKVTVLILICCISLQQHLLEARHTDSSRLLFRNKRALSANQIKAQIDATNSWEVLGLGGRYGSMQDSVSKANLIESDHFPPKAIYKSAKDENIKNIMERNMAAVSLRYLHHRQFITTGYSPDAQRRLKELFEQGKYYDAINLNIGWYKSNPDRDGEARSRFDYLIKQGIMDALQVHVENKLITSAEKQELINIHQLDDNKFPTLANIVDSQLREDARAYLLSRI